MKTSEALGVKPALCLCSLIWRLLRNVRCLTLWLCGVHGCDRIRVVHVFIGLVVVAQRWTFKVAALGFPIERCMVMDVVVLA